MAIGFFNKETKEEKMYSPWSLFIYMKSPDFLCHNIKYNIILDSIKEMHADALDLVIGVSENEYISMNNFLLEIIRAYDSQSDKNAELLDFALNVAEIIYSKSKDAISLINKLQIVKRQRKLTNDEISSLVILRNEPQQTSSVRCGVAILLDEIDKAKQIITEMPESEQKHITNYPIYELIASRQTS